MILSKGNSVLFRGRVLYAIKEGSNDLTSDQEKVFFAEGAHYAQSRRGPMILFWIRKMGCVKYNYREIKISICANCLWIKWVRKHYPEDSPTKVLGSKSVILQDNISIKQLEICVKRSSTKQTRHIDIRYFCVRSKVHDQTVTTIITYCPTKKMVTNFLRRPLKGSLFRTHKNSIMVFN